MHRAHMSPDRAISTHSRPNFAFDVELRLCACAVVQRRHASFFGSFAAPGLIVTESFFGALGTLLCRWMMRASGSSQAPTDAQSLERLAKSLLQEHDQASPAAVQWLTS